MDSYFVFDMLVTIYAEELLRPSLQQRRLRDHYNPFDVPTSTFKSYYRIDQDTALMIVDVLENALFRQRRHGLPIAIQVLTAIRFFAVGSYQGAVGRECFNNMSQSSVSRCVNSVSSAICDKMLRDWVKFPMTKRERILEREKFANCLQPFPRTIGAIDCTHVAILAPSEHEEDYLNRHHYHSLNVQAIVGADMQILSICPKYGGSRHDSFIWQFSPERRVMELWYGKGERKTWIIGDSGYFLEPWLMTPLLNTDEGTPERRYTDAHVKARSVVERSFGLLKMRWRCLSDQRVLMYSPTASAKIICACAVLHNICVRRNIEQEINDDEVYHSTREHVAHYVTDRPNRECQRIQESLIREYFSD